MPELFFDVTGAPEVEALAIQFCEEIAGPLGAPCSSPDPVRLLEMAEELFEAALEAKAKNAAWQALRHAMARAMTYEEIGDYWLKRADAVLAAIMAQGFVVIRQ